MQAQPPRAPAAPVPGMPDIATLRRNAREQVD